MNTPVFIYKYSKYKFRVISAILEGKPRVEFRAQKNWLVEALESRLQAGSGSCSLTSLRSGWLCHRCQWQRSRCRDSTACRKFVANPSKSEIYFFVFHQNQLRCIQNYNIYCIKVISSK